MKECKVCGKPIVNQARLCPHCGSRVKKTPVGLIVVLCLLFIGVIGNMAKNQDENADNKRTQKTYTTTQSVQQKENHSYAPSTSNSNNQEPEAEKKLEQTTFKKGETAERDGVSVTLTRVWETSGRQFLEPTDGNIYVICEFEIENNSNKELHVSSLMSFDVYVDEYSEDLSIGAVSSVEKSSIDGTVAPGKKISGVYGVEVAKDWKTVEIHYQPFTLSKEIVFSYNKFEIG